MANHIPLNADCLVFVLFFPAKHKASACLHVVLNCKLLHLRPPADIISLNVMQRAAAIPVGACALWGHRREIGLGVWSWPLFSPFYAWICVFLLKSSLESGPCSFRYVPDLALHLSQKIKPCPFWYRTPNCTREGAGGRVSASAGLLPDGVASKRTPWQLCFYFIYSLYYDFSSKNNISSMEKELTRSQKCW